MGRWRVNKICRAPRSLHARPGILRSRALQCSRTIAVIRVWYAAYPPRPSLMVQE